MSKDDLPLETKSGRKQIPSGQKKLGATLADKRKVAKRSSTENQKVEDEIIMDFLANTRKQRGVINRNEVLKGSEKLLEELSNVLASSFPKKGKGARNPRIYLKFNPVFFNYMVEYSAENGYFNVNEAVRVMIRDALRAKGKPV